MMSFLGLLHFLVIIAFATFTNATLSSTSSADTGGNRGFGLGFNDVNQYAAVSDYFPTADYWPTYNMTVSAWLRFTGLSVTGKARSFGMTMLVNGDTNHVQPFILMTGSDYKYYFAPCCSATCHTLSQPIDFDFWSYWTKVTFVYKTTGTTSFSQLYANGTLLESWTDSGRPLRWSDGGTMMIGGYAVSPVSFSAVSKFVGWIDDLAFYNRAFTADEVAASWNSAANVNDPSLFIYYNFDEGPGSDLIKNHGVAGSVADLFNGKVFGGTFYVDSVSSQLSFAQPAHWVPGAPVQGLNFSVPITYAVDVHDAVHIVLSCPDSHAPSNATLLSNISVFSASSVLSDVGGIYNSMSSSVASIVTGSQLTIFPFPVSDFIYVAPYILPDAFFPTNPLLLTLSFQSRCSGFNYPQNGSVFLFVSPPPTAETDISQTLVMNTPNLFFLHGSHGIGGLLQAEITSLPLQGTLYQMNYSNPSISGLAKLAITSVPTVVSHPLLAVLYIPNSGESGSDSIGFRVFHNNVTSSLLTSSSSMASVSASSVALSIQAWDFPPQLPSTIKLENVHRSAQVIDLQAYDTLQGKYIGVYITSLPKKGKLYQVLEDGVSQGPEITQAYSPYILRQPIYQYASSVLNVSSFWGGSLSWSPSQALGPQDCFVYGDCQTSWCPLTMSGTGGMVSGSGNGLSFSNNPSADYSKYGYTEYIELGFDTEVFASELLIGENRGMGAIKNILAKDPRGEWMYLYHVDTVDPSVQALYAKFSQYRYFQPDLCTTMFKTRHLRFEMDTRDTPDWNEWDFFKLGGYTMPDNSEVDAWQQDDANGPMNGEHWRVLYVPDDAASGVDSFTYSANDCPTSKSHWSSIATVEINIVPEGVAAIVPCDRYDGCSMDLTDWSRGINGSMDLTFQITALPSTGTLSMNGVSVVLHQTISHPRNLTYTPLSSCAERVPQFMYQSSDSRQTSPVQISLDINCPRACSSADMVYEILSCTAASGGQGGEVQPIRYVWNETTIASGGCVPSSSFVLPSDYLTIPCGSVSFQSPVSNVAFFFFACIAILGAVFIIWLFAYSSIPLVKLTQPGHSAAFCLGGIWLQGAWLTFLGPITKESCANRSWMLCLSYSLMIGSLIRKIFVVFKILNQAKKMKKVANQNKGGISHRTLGQLYSALTIGLCLGIDVLILIAFNVASPLSPISKSFQVPYFGNIAIPDYECGSSQNMLFTGLLIGYKVLITFTGVYYALKVRTLDSVIGESKMMLYTTYNIVVSGILLLIITYIATIAPATWLGVASAVCFVAVFFSLSLLFLPKMYLHMSNAKINTAEMFGRAARTGSEPGSSSDDKDSSSYAVSTSKRDKHSATTGNSSRVAPSSDVQLIDPVSEAEEGSSPTKNAW